LDGFGRCISFVKRKLVEDERERRGRVGGRSTGGGVPPILLMQSQSPKDIARSDITNCL